MTEQMVDAYLMKTDLKSMTIAYIPLGEIHEIIAIGGLSNLDRPIAMMVCSLAEGEEMKFYDLLVKSNVGDAYYKN